MSLGQQLSTALNREADCLEQLLDILLQEYEALLSADIEAIELAIGTKNQALETQAAATLSRQDVTSQSAYDDTGEGLQQFIASCENREELADSFARMNSLAQQCSAINRANGRLIRQKQAQANGALSVIRQTGSVTPTYSGQGKSMATQATRSLGKA